ncbi:ankyrin repeat domain-containing protein [Planctomycetota bacterium]
MESWLSEIVDYLHTQSWQIAILCIMMATASFVLRHRSAHIRYLLWLIVLAKCLAPPIHPIRLPVLPERQQPAPISYTPSFDSKSQSGDLDVLPMPSEYIKEPTLSFADTVIGFQSQDKPVRWSRRVWMGLGWIAAATMLLISYLLKAVRMQWWLKLRRTPLSFELRSDLESILAAQGITHPPRIWQIKGMSQPFVWGLVRGSIYLPAVLVQRGDRKALAGLLGHEASHVIRYDAAVNVLQMISQIMFWFHPLVWWANSKIRVEREKCCDEATIARTHSLPEDYSNAIVDILATKREYSQPAPSLAVAGPIKGIEERIRTMLRPGKHFHKRPSLMTAVVVLLLALLTVPTAVVLSARTEAETSAPSSEELNAVGKLEYIDHLTSDDLSSVTSIEISSDGRYAYAAAYNVGTLAVFKRNVKTGYIERIQTISRDTEADIYGAVAARLSPCGRYLVCTSVRTNTVFLFERDEATGLLKVLDKVKVNTEGTQGLVRLADVAISPDSRFAYVAADDSAEIIVYRLTEDGKLALIESQKGEDKCLDGVRSVAVSPDGSYMYTTSCWGNALSVFERDSTTGSTSLVQVIRDEEGNVHGLAGAFYVMCSTDGKFVYTSSGRWNGDSAICVFKRGSDGKLSLIQELRDGQDGLTGFVGGNELRISPDEQHLYGLGTRSNSVVAFRRNAETGQLTYLQTFYNSLVAGCDGSASGIGISQDGEYIYVAGEFDSSILILKCLTRTVKKSSQALHSAASSGDIVAAKSLITKGADVNLRAKRGYTPLHWAAKVGQKEMVELLIASGADINARTGSSGWTPLHLAIRQQSNDVAELLISKGADINAVNQNNGQTPLLVATMAGNVDMAGLLLSKGVDIDKRYGKIGTLLHCAAANGHAKVVDMLLDKGADLEAKTNDGLTALHYACMYGHTSVAQRLIERGADTDVKVYGNMTLLHLAVINGQKDLVEPLIAKGATVNAKAAGLRTALFFAAENNYGEIVKLLIENGADFNIPNWTGETPLSIAKQQKHTEVVSILREYGATDTLHGAAASGDIDTVKRLLSQGADINARGDYQATPLMTAAGNGHEDIVKILLENGAAINLLGSGNQTALVVAKRRKHIEIVNILRQYGATYTLLDATEAGDIDEVRNMISSMTEVNVKNMNGHTPLHRAARSGRRDIADLLISKGADVNATSPAWESTPLHCAAHKGRADVADLLLAQGAKLEVTNLYGQTPLHLAADAGSRKVAGLLLARGANIEARTKYDRTPLGMALNKSNNKTGMAEFLLDKGADIKAKEGDETLLHRAINGNRPGIVKFLLTKGLDTTALNKVAFFGQLEEVKALVAKGANVNEKDACGYSPLHCAICGRHTKLVIFLIESGTDINAQVDNGRFPLFYADRDIAKLLVAKGADVKLKDKMGESVLHWAVNRNNHQGDIELINLYLSHGADVNAKAYSNCTEWEGWTPAHVACRNGNKAVVEMLISHGANLIAKTDKGQTPTSLAKEKGYTEIVELLKKHGAKE